MRNAGLDAAQAGIKIVGRNINNIKCADDTTLMAESEELQSLLMKVKKWIETVDLKLNIQKTKMASSPITSWKNTWGNNGNSDRLFFGGGGGAPNSLHMVTAAMKLKDACYLEEKLLTTKIAH